MELKIYLRILRKKWWLVFLAFVTVFSASAVFTFAQEPIYRAIASFVVTPSSSSKDPRAVTNDLEVLSARTQIASTYTEMATSDRIKQEVADLLNLSPEQRALFSVQARLRAGTNVIDITVEGNDPALVRDFANLVGERTVAFAQKMYEVYEMKPLDPAGRPNDPVRPNKKLNLALGAILGLALGIGLAFLFEYLQTPLEPLMNPGILDIETGALNRTFLAQRLGQEISRAKRNQYPLSLCLLNVDQAGTLRSALPSQSLSQVLRQVTALLRQNLREEDLVARLDKTTFAVLLPDLGRPSALVMVEALRTKLFCTTFETQKNGVKLHLDGAAGVVTYDHKGQDQYQFLAEAERALQQLKMTGAEQVFAALENRPPEHLSA